MKILITGISGFAGSHLTGYLRGIDGIEVAGLDVQGPSDRFTGLFDDGGPTVHGCDMADRKLLDEILRIEKPDAIIHLAARAQVAGAWQQAGAILETNVIGTQILMQAVQEAVPRAKVLLISSSEVYGRVTPQELPITETAALKPNNPYSVSKAAQEFVGLAYHEAFDMEVVIARPFNHIGPMQVGNFVVPAFARQVAEIEAGIREPVIKVGNLESLRDFTDVRDIVRAYYLLVAHGRAGEVYNIASGESHAISEILEMLLDIAKIAPEIENIPELMRPSDTPVVEGDSSKLKLLQPWAAEIPLRQSLEDTLDYWREQVRVK
ncbi:MAG: GDP-mannose 4,6-dehydratase [Thermoleophilia bacterium]